MSIFKNLTIASINFSILVAMGSVAVSHHAEAQAVKEKEVSQAEIMCLAKNIYFENHGRSEADAYGVSDAIMNRVEDSRYPNTVCAVVQQGKKNADGSMKRNSCMFSWYCDGKSDNPRKGKAWDNSLKYAVEFYSGKGRGISQGANHYHAHNMTPYWADDLDKVGRIGSHVFYRWN